MYGMGAASIAVSINGTVEEAQEIIDGFYKAFPTVKNWIDKTQSDAKKNGYVEDLWGRRRRLPDILLPEYEVKYDAQDDEDLDFCPFIESLGIVKSGQKDKLDEYYKKAVQARSRKTVDSLIRQAKADGIIMHSNSNKIAQAERQCVNARIQGCLAGGVTIITKEKGVQPISNVVGEHLHVWDGEYWSESDIVYSGLKKKCIITFVGDKKIVCSPNHKFLVVDNDKNREFVTCENLKAGMQIITNTQCPINASSLIFNSESITIKSIEITDEDIEMYDVCDTDRGFFVADGLVVHNSAATMSKKAMIKVHDDEELAKLDFNTLICVHDELIGECPEEYADAVADRLTTIMKHAAEPDVIVPFKCDPTIERCWYYSDYLDTLQEEYKQRINKGESKEDILNDFYTNSHCECTKEQIDEMLADIL